MVSLIWEYVGFEEGDRMTQTCDFLRRVYSVETIEDLAKNKNMPKHAKFRERQNADSDNKMTY
jgi:hypothetical protein